MTITFDGVELKNVQEFDRAPEVRSTVTTLASGAKSIQSSSTTGFRREYHCTTTSRSDVTALLAKIGTTGTLVEDGTSYTNCQITAWLKDRTYGDTYEYAVRIERDTS